jgi:Protein of unknown function (DUF3060)
MKKLAFVILLGSSPALADLMVIENDETHTVDCAKDKKVMISGNGAKITLTGTCENVMISGNDAKVTGSATNVMVSGNKNTVELDATLSIKVSGNSNTVSYKKSTDPKKKVGVLNSGNGNKVTQAK